MSPAQERCLPKRRTMINADIDFRYWTNGRRKPLPGWSKYYLELGESIAHESEKSQRLVTALAVPTRSYAAVLIAAGVIIARARTIGRNYGVSTTGHFEMLSSLPLGTSVILRQGKKTVKGILVGTRDTGNDGVSRIGVQTQNRKSGGLIEWLPPASSTRVQVSSKTWTQLPANAAKAGNANTHRSAFISRVLQGKDLWNFFSRSTLDCVILGTVKRLVREATDTKLSVGNRGREESAGTIGDILRIRKLNGDTEAFRSDVLPVNSSRSPSQTKDIEPHIAIFDGAAGFLKWRDDWSDSNRIVVLDRTEPWFVEASQMVNEEYLSRVGEVELSFSKPPPPSVDLVAFLVDG